MVSSLCQHFSKHILRKEEMKQGKGMKRKAGGKIKQQEEMF